MSGNQLKILALVTMTIDHVGVVLLPQFVILRIIGRLSYPIFAYMIAEGCFYTHSKSRYLCTIFALGFICQLAYFFALSSLEQSILTTFVLAIMVVYALQHLANRRSVEAIVVLGVVVLIDLFVCLGIPTLLWNTDFSIDYGFAGTLLPALCYLPRIIWPGLAGSALRRSTLPFALVGLVCIALGISGFSPGVQWFSLAAVVFLACYSGKRGKRHMKYLFYIYYPAHLLVIYAISLFI